MVIDRATLDRASAAARELARRRAERPLDHVRWLPGQMALLTCTAKKKLLRAGQQAQGKTTAGAGELLLRLEGRSPYRDDLRPAPILAWVVAGGGEQSQIIQKRVWELCDKRLVADGCEFDPKKGAFVGRFPRLRFKNGSVAEFKSGSQDSLNLASGTIDFCWIDEPPESERVYGELLKRLLKRNGDMVITATPINRPTAWLKDECATEQIRDLHFRLTPENLIPVGSSRPLRLLDGTVCDAAWIARVVAETAQHEVPVVVHGEWEHRAIGANFRDVFDPDRHIRVVVPTGKRHIVLGVDHGSAPGKQVAVLSYVDESGPFPSIYVADEYSDESGTSLPEQDAAGILAMLARNGLRWFNLDEAWGDRIHLPGHLAQKSNLELVKHIAASLRVPATKLLPTIGTVRKAWGNDGAGPVELRERFAYYAMARPDGFAMHPRCKRGRLALEKYQGSDDAFGSKDWFDGWTYGLQKYIFGPSSAPKGPAPILRFGTR